ncbi:MAG TPA: SUMF1/EgtB/PvdO family nonheme iron enzyme, partial [Candidatus Acidoferrum sp.]|nr:SUMF1/EgtB/PvdO family nonheme iron enzyme [Candidatus Acidoferrum sp.]
VPVKFVVFPGEPHGPRKLTHQMRKVEEEVAWFDRYFFKTEKPANDAVKKGSPLEDSLRRNNAERSGSLYGARAKAKDGSDILVPEVSKRGELEIARFETTRGQYNVYWRSLHGGKRSDVQQDTSSSGLDFPAHGISLADARDYAAWLSKATGQAWRIPYEDEVKGLYEKRDGENTLDYWAGYAPNPEDAAKLREAAKKLNGTAPLLKETGSFHGQGRDDEDPVYDLGGNAAEWVLTRGGSGKVIGGSADCPADPRANCTPAPEYVGFRVVRGEAKPAPAPAGEKH